MPSVATRLLVPVLLALLVGGCGAGGKACVGLTDPACAGNLHIELRSVTPPGGSEPTPGQLQLFDSVKRRLESIITRKLGHQRISLGAGECGEGSPAVDEEVDDLLVFVMIGPIDGSSGPGSGTAVAQATSCLVRDQTSLPIVSYVRLDAADILTLQQSDMLERVFLHELLHALGFGNVWGPRFFGFLKEPSKPSSPGVDTYFSGRNAVLAFDQTGGENYFRNKVPVENSGGAQADNHWRGTVLRGELMQPFLDPGPRPVLSLVTLRSLEDLGYAVDLAQAETYHIHVSTEPAASTAPSGPVRFDSDPGLPVRSVDRSGRVVRVIER